jgi:hypothetical protein
MINRYLAIFIGVILISCSTSGLENNTQHDDERESESKNDKIKGKKNKSKSGTQEEYIVRLSQYDTLIEFDSDISFDLKLSEPIDIEEYYLPQNLIDSFFNTFGNQYEEALAIEDLKINAHPNLAYKDSTGLHLLLNNGKWKTLIPNYEIEEFDHTLEFVFIQIPYYSVRVQWDEGNGYKLINQNTGKVFSLFGRPYPSPNKKYLATVSSDINAGFSFNGIQLFKITEDNIELIASYEPKKWGPVSLMWKNDEEIILKNETVDWDNLATDYLNFYSLLKISFKP